MPFIFRCPRDGLFRSQIEGAWQGLKVVAQGTGGVGAFFLIWLTWVSAFPDAFHISVPKGWSFQISNRGRMARTESRGTRDRRSWGVFPHLVDVGFGVS